MQFILNATAESTFTFKIKNELFIVKAKEKDQRLKTKARTFQLINYLNVFQREKKNTGPTTIPIRHVHPHFKTIKIREKRISAAPP